MCSSPDVPAAPAPTTPPQAAKAPDTNIFQNRKRITQAGMPNLPTSSPLLTGSTGVPTSSLNLGGVTLLGGQK